MVTLESCVPVPPPQPSHDNSSLVALFYPPLHNLNILLKEAMLSFDQSLLTPFFHVPMATIAPILCNACYIQCTERVIHQGIYQLFLQVTNILPCPATAND